MLLGTTTIPGGTMRQASLVAATLLVAGSLGCSGDGDESTDAEATTTIGEALAG